MAKIKDEPEPTPLTTASSSTAEAIEWLSPWIALSASASAAHEQRLARALPKSHELSSRTMRALGATEESDDVLFEVTNPADETTRYVVAHLPPGKSTPAKQPAILPFATLAEFIEGCMQPDHLEHHAPEDEAEDDGLDDD
jgi:hypothetical protein